MEYDKEIESLEVIYCIIIYCVIYIYLASYIKLTRKWARKYSIL